MLQAVNKLDEFTSEYSPESPTAIENNLLLHWYPKRVVDRSPHKQGKLMPGAHVPIVATEQLAARAPDVTLLLAWNFKYEILAQQTAYRDAGGKFLIPIPEVRLV